MTILEPKECWLPNKVFVSMYLVGLISLSLVAVSGIVDRHLSESAASLTIVLFLMGGVALMKNISIIRCPSRVLVSGIVFMAVTAFLDANYF